MRHCSVDGEHGILGIQLHGFRITSCCALEVPFLEPRVTLGRKRSKTRILMNQLLYYLLLLQQCLLNRVFQDVRFAFHGRFHIRGFVHGLECLILTCCVGQAVLSLIIRPKTTVPRQIDPMLRNHKL